MKKNTLSDLRDHLFDVLERVKDGNDPEADPKDTIDLDRAKVIANVSKQIIDSAKVEVEAVKVLNDTVNFDIQQHMKKVGILEIGEGDGK